MTALSLLCNTYCLPTWILYDFLLQTQELTDKSGNINEKDFFNFLGIDGCHSEPFVVVKIFRFIFAADS